jgi:hypothetical protein
MSRLYTLATWSVSSLAIALALLVPLAVPEGALADAGTDAVNAGTVQCPNAFDQNGNFIGCANPGAQCYCGTKVGSCGLSQNMSNCNCNCP